MQMSTCQMSVACHHTHKKIAFPICSDNNGDKMEKNKGKQLQTLKVILELSFVCEIRKQVL